jgi:hypothetical protein
MIIIPVAVVVSDGTNDDDDGVVIIIIEDHLDAITIETMKEMKIMMVVMMIMIIIIVIIIAAEVAVPPSLLVKIVRIICLHWAAAVHLYLRHMTLLSIHKQKKLRWRRI